MAAFAACTAAALLVAPAPASAQATGAGRAGASQSVLLDRIVAVVGKKAITAN